MVARGEVNHARQVFVIHGFELKCHDCFVRFPKAKLFDEGSPLHALSGQGVVSTTLHNQGIQLVERDGAAADLALAIEGSSYGVNNLVSIEILVRSNMRTQEDSPSFLMKCSNIFQEFGLILNHLSRWRGHDAGYYRACLGDGKPLRSVLISRGQDATSNVDGVM